MSFREADPSLDEIVTDALAEERKLAQGQAILMRDLQAARERIAALETVIDSPTARVTHSADQSVPSSSLVTLSFDTVSYDTHGFLSGDRLVVPFAAVWRYTFTMSWQGNSTGWRQILLEDSGGTIHASDVIPAGVTITHAQGISHELFLEGGDGLIARCQQDSGVTLQAQSRAWSPIFSVSLVTRLAVVGEDL